MTRVSNLITGGLQAGPTITAGTIVNLNIDSEGRVTTLRGSCPQSTEDAESGALAAEFRTELDRPGPRLAVLTQSEAAVVYSLSRFAGDVATDLDPLAEALATRLSDRVAEYGASGHGLAVPIREFRTELDRPGPLMAVLTQGECAVAYGLLAAVAAAYSDLDPIAKAIASRLSARMREHQA
ncbi:hypothetical protein [Streptomyces sp. NPDC094031]|uniref:hypothetical protein n=1 Tax=Streptomyces sp. NPDC094031 TaxID=3155307 RepID=UPI003327126D